MKEELKLKKWSLAKWKKELWKYFATYIKLRDKNICFTCGRKTTKNNAHAGHFIPKGACGLELYFHEDNVHCQCAGCNLFLQGNQYEYGKRLGKTAEKLKEIHRKNNNRLHYTKQDYQKLIKIYEQKIKEKE